jgi:hypothetical protein
LYMSIFDYRITPRVMREIDDVMRSQTPDIIRVQIERFKQAGRRLAGKERRLAGSTHAASGSNGAGGIGPENLIWIFGTIRTGSTWLGSMMGDMKGYEMWNEPRVGELFGYFYYERAAHRRENRNFIMGLHYREVWLKSIRSFVLDAVAARYQRLADSDYLIIKEPSGSIGAPLLIEALPESCMIFLIRDPRDVVASSIDASRKGGWAYELRGNRKRREAMDGERRDALARKTTTRLDRYVKNRANMYLQYVGNSKEAYEAHRGPKALVRYEGLRTDTLATMRRIYSELEIPLDEEELAQAVEKHSWENIPEEEKGEGKFKRKAKPGGWREDLTPEQARMVEEITAPLLKEFYPA